MKVLVTGGTGFVGSELVRRLRGRGDQPMVWTRDVASAREELGEGVLIVSPEAGDRLDVVAASVPAIVNLAGANLFEGRWTEQRKEVLRSSRLETTRAVASGMLRSTGPQVLVSASAVGLYGPRGDEVLSEDARPGDDFLATLCLDWEAAAGAADAPGKRVVCLRLGVVFGPGGALQTMRKPFALGLGGPLADGEQWMSWIHRDDLVALLLAALDDPRYEGAVNATAPHPVTNATLTRELARALSRPAALRVPAFALKLALGEASVVLLEGQRVVPEAALKLDFSFAYPTVHEALAEALAPSPR